MDKENLDREIQELRRQVELLSSEKPSRDEVEEPPAEEGAGDDEEKMSAMRAKIEDFMSTVQKDLSEIPATTAVGIFALGVLVGRLLPR